MPQIFRMIDQSRIDELRTEIGEEDLSFIVAVYLDEARATLDQVANGLPPEEEARAVHFLRSGALNIGLRGIAQMAGQLEQELKSDSVQRTVCAKLLYTALNKTMAELESAFA